MINWSNENWRTQERWGQIHPEKPWNWYDPSCVEPYGIGLLNLHIKENPKFFEINGENVLSPYGTGLISSEANFSPGYFELVCKLPKGIGLWPAFWIYAAECWPPEIDIFEAYSRETNYKVNCLLPYRIETCIHTRGSDGKVKSMKPQAALFYESAIERPTETFNSYAVSFDRDELVFFHNGEPMRRVKDKKLLDKLCQHQYQVIINNHIGGHYAGKHTAETPFVLKSFRYQEF